MTCIRCNVTTSIDYYYHLDLALNHHGIVLELGRKGNRRLTAAVVPFKITLMTIKKLIDQEKID
jgi:hypothetical protein